MSIGVIGLGYVGLPLAVAFAEAGERVVAVDVDEAKISAIEAGESYIEDISSERLQAARPNIEAWSHFAPLAKTDAVLICVPTPLTANREPDLGPLIAAGTALGQIVQSGQLVVLESTTYPGTTREQLVPLLEHRGLTVGGGAERCLLARASRSWPDRLHDAQHAQDRRRDDPGVHRAGGRALRARLR